MATFLRPLLGKGRQARMSGREVVVVRIGRKGKQNKERNIERMRKRRRRKGTLRHMG